MHSRRALELAADALDRAAADAWQDGNTDMGDDLAAVRNELYERAEALPYPPEHNR